jgi:LysR family hydrogen peroxide-inducible transcriptional activator
MVASGYGISVLPAGTLSGIYRSDMVVPIPFEEPVPSRRIALAWRQRFTRPQAIEVIIEAVGRIDNPSYRIIPRQ